MLLLVACTETRDPLAGTQSIAVELVSPDSPGDVNNRLSDAQRTVVLNLRALDPNGETDTAFDATLRVYAQFLGTLTPDLEQMPLASIAMTGGVAMNQSIDLPVAYGATTLWIDNGTGLGPDYEFGAVTGTSPTLWYRDPFIDDLQRPRDEMAVDALSATPLTDKQIRVGASRYGARGAIVVTSTFAQGYTASDVQCMTGGPKPTPPCTTNLGPDGVPGTSDDHYDHIMVFTFSAPRDQFGRQLLEGSVIESFNGGLSEFNGLTEVGFPRTFIPVPDPVNDPAPQAHVDRALMPEPVEFDLAWFGPLSDPNGRINFERNEAGAIRIRNAKVCPIDDAPDGVYTRFKQWTIDPDPAGSCDTSSSASRSRLINLITAGTDFTTDPHTLVGQTLDTVVGIVRPVNLQGFNVWIVYPRGKDDIVL